MPLGNVVGEVNSKVTSVKVHDLGGGATRIEMDVTGEETGQAAGQHFGTLCVTANAPLGSPLPYNYTGVTLTKSGAVVNMSGVGYAIVTAQGGFKGRYLGTVRFTTDDPNLAAMNKVVVATDSVFDPAAMTIKGTASEWN